MQSNWQLASLFTHPLTLTLAPSEDSGLDLTYSPAVDESPYHPQPTPPSHPTNNNSHLPLAPTPNSGNPELTLDVLAKENQIFLAQLTHLQRGLKAKQTAGHERRRLRTRTAPRSSTCAICLEVVKRKSTVHALKCKHLFHRQCLKKWRRVNDNCPLCRAVPR